MNLKKIPFTKGYYASDTGAIFNANKEEVSQSTRATGYKSASVEMENGSMRNFPVHRLELMAFKPREGMENLIGNHRDFDPSNNALENLEWVTPAQNNLHLALFRPNAGKPVCYIRSPNGDYEWCYHVLQAADKMQCKALDVWDSIKDGIEVNGFRAFGFTNFTKIPEALKKKKKGVSRIATRPIKALDTHTGDVTNFTTSKEAARYFGTSTSLITLTMSENDKVRFLRGRYLLVDAHEEFPEFTKEDLEFSLNILGKRVLVYDLTKEIYLDYKSAAAFIRDKGLSRRKVTKRLRKNKIENVNNYYFVYYTPENRHRLAEVVGNPVPTLA